MKDKAGWSTLHHIAMYGYTSYYFMPEKIIQIMADSGADINATNKYRVSPLMIASAKAFMCERMFEVVKALIRNGADYRMKDKERGNAKHWLLNGNGYRYGFQTAMIEEIYDEITKSAENIGFSDINLDLLVRVLWATQEDIEPILSAGADINLHTASDYTPLMMATVFNDINTVKFLLEHGADVSVKNSEGETALSLAAKNSDTDKMTLIMEYGGDFSALQWIDRNYYTKNTQTTDYLSYCRIYAAITKFSVLLAKSKNY